ncbi:hypothetical protein PRNP1_004530 [Phytophthora ramorum]
MKQDADDGGVEDRVGNMLQQEVLEAMNNKVAADYAEFKFDANSIKFLKGHRLPVHDLEDGVLGGPGRLAAALGPPGRGENEPAEGAQGRRRRRQGEDGQ